MLDTHQPRAGPSFPKIAPSSLPTDHHRLRAYVLICAASTNLRVMLDIDGYRAR